MDRDTPPNFTGTYPLAGERIGPAWRAAWALLVDAARSRRAWVRSSTLAAAMCEAAPIERSTARRMLTSARSAGVVEVRHDGPRGEASFRVPRRRSSDRPAAPRIPA